MLRRFKLSAAPNFPSRCCTIVHAIVLFLAVCVPLPSSAAERVADQSLSEFQSMDEAEMISVIVTLHDADSEIRQLRENTREISQKKASISERQAQRRGTLARHQDKTLTRLQKSDYKLAHKYSELPFLSLKVNRKGLSTLLADPGVSVSKVKYFRPLLDTSVPLIMDEVGTYNPSVDHNRGAEWAVAVLDTGIESAHPFLGGRIVSEACYSTQIYDLPPTTHPPLCPGGVVSSTDPGSGEPCTVVSACNHGTRIAGVVAGNGTLDSIETDGVATAAELVSINVFSYDDSPGGQGLVATTSDIVAGLERALIVHQTDNNIDLASVLMAFGVNINSADCDTFSVALKVAVDNLKAAGIATVSAAGNSGHPGGMDTPACISTVISVGASTDLDVKWAASNEAGGENGLDLYAPGVDITSSDISGGSAMDSGTSFSAAHVAGAWAVLKQASPAATVDQVSTVLMNTGIDVTGNTPSGAKRIDLKAALSADITGTAAEMMFPVKSKTGEVFIIGL